MPGPQLTLSIEPAAGGAVRYAPLAPAKAAAAATAQLALQVVVTNTGTSSAHVTGFSLTFSGGPAVAAVSFPVDLDVAAGQSVEWHMSQPQYVLLPVPAPASVTLTASTDVRGTTWSVTRSLVAHSNPPPGGGYAFPARAGDLRVGEYWSGRSSAHAPAGDASQMFAYDLDVIAADGAGGWSFLLPGTDGTANEHYRIWGKPVYASGAGTVVDFRADIPTNPVPGADLSPPNPVEGNHFYLQHGDELVLYAHLQPGSLNPALTGKGKPVGAGQFLGLAGNSATRRGRICTCTPSRRARRGPGRRGRCCGAGCRWWTGRRSRRRRHPVRGWSPSTRGCRRRRPRSGRRRPHRPGTRRAGRRSPGTASRSRRTRASSTRSPAPATGRSGWTGST